MPRYEFQCKQCKDTFEQSLSVQDKTNGMAECPKCKSKDITQLFAGININTGKQVKSKQCGCCGGNGCCS